MAGIAFHYLPGTSLLHRIDPRIKLGSLVLFAVLTMKASPAGLFPLSLVLPACLAALRYPLRQAIKDLRGLLFLIGLIVGVRFALDGIEGGILGLIYGWRLCLLLLAALVFLGTTRIGEIRMVILWLFSPVPFINEVRVATMFSMALAFVPELMDQMANCAKAQKSRCLGSSNKIVRKIRAIGSSLTVRSLLRVDAVARAMESRCYGEKTRATHFSLHRSDFYFAIGLMALFAFSLTLHLLLS